MKKIPYGWPIIVAMIIAGGFFLSFSEVTNPGYGFISAGFGTIVIIILAILCGVAAIVFFINSIIVDKRSKEIKSKPEDRELYL
jgi:membrane-bound ClpP family serine protease